MIENFQNGNHVQYRFGRIFIYVGESPYNKNNSVVYDPYTSAYIVLPTQDLKIATQEPE